MIRKNEGVKIYMNGEQGEKKRTHTKEERIKNIIRKDKYVKRYLRTQRPKKNMIKGMIKKEVYVKNIYRNAKTKMRKQRMKTIYRLV